MGSRLQKGLTLVTDDNFDEQAYLAANPDVAQAVQEGKIRSGREHFELFGRKEGRKIRVKFLVPKEKVSDEDHRIFGGRNDIIKLYLKMGNGIEIGALHNPVQVPSGVNVRYVDRLNVDELRQQYPELNTKPPVRIDILADGERLETIEDTSQDFVIANHFLEHCQNPILAIENMLRVVKSSGILFLALPDKRYTFDIDRPFTPYEHLVKDYVADSEMSQREHFEDWARLVNKLTDPLEIEKQVANLMNINYSIHFHVWTQTEMIELLLELKRKLAFEVELIYRNGPEMVIVLRKC
jgi:predicted SAM-dependent methyltransferase